jgi:hypothetical protein
MSRSDIASHIYRFADSTFGHTFYDFYDNCRYATVNCGWHIIAKRNNVKDGFGTRRRPRSRYLLRILEKLYLGKKSVKNSNQDPLDRGFASLQSSESEGP